MRSCDAVELVQPCRLVVYPPFSQDDDVANCGHAMDFVSTFFSWMHLRYFTEPSSTPQLRTARVRSSQLVYVVMGSFNMCGRECWRDVDTKVVFAAGTIQSDSTRRPLSYMHSCLRVKHCTFSHNMSHISSSRV